jgi:hypothetical protein
MKPSSKYYRPHFVNEDTEKVYVTVQNMSGAMTAPFWVKKYFPGYTCCIVTDEALQNMFTTKTDD